MRMVMKHIGVMCSFILVSCGSSDQNTAHTSALVKVQTMHRMAVPNTVSGYGAVVPDELYIQNMSPSRAIQLSKVLVVSGTAVEAGASLFEYATAPGEASTYQTTQSTLEDTQKALIRTQQLFVLQLATRAQLLSAEKAFHDARAAQLSEKQMGIPGANQYITSPAEPGIVLSVTAHVGDRVGAGTVIAQWIPRNACVVAINVNADQMQPIKLGLDALIYPLNAKTPYAGVVTAVQAALNVQGVATVFVKPATAVCQALWIGNHVRGEIVLARPAVWVLPAQAVLQDAKGFYIYRVRAKKAERLEVTVLFQSGHRLAISGPLQEGDQVVIEGNYELENNMSVRW